MRKLMRRVAKNRMKKAGMIRVCKHKEGNESYFAQHWREYVKAGQKKKKSQSKRQGSGAALAVMLLIAGFTFTGCNMEGIQNDTINTIRSANVLQSNQPTPTDIDYSLERYNLIRRAYWVNGQREKAVSLPCEIEKPLGYIVLFSGNVTVGNFIVDGKVSSLNSFLTPDSEHYSYEYTNDWLPDIDGSYGENDSGIFFFTPDGKYIEWSGEYLYSDIPLAVESPVLKIGG